MTETEFAKLALAIREMYPQSGVLQTKTSMEIWYQLISDLPYEEASATLSSWMSTNKWPPTVADIREGAAKSIIPEIPEWSAAWETVLAAISRWGMYRQAEALATMDETTRETVNRIGWQYICWSENISIERANFRDIYTSIKSRKDQQAKLPESLQLKLDRMRAAAIEEKR